LTGGGLTGGDRTTVVVVGGGVLGSTHALWAIEHDFLVVHLERELVARGASVRNFGLVWVGGRAGGPELELAVRSRTLWEALAREIPAVGFRPAGSLTVATTEPELSLMKEALQRNDVAARQWELVDGSGARELNGELSREAVAGGLYCRADAIVEPREAVAAIQAYLSRQAGYTWLPGRAVVELAKGAVRDDSGGWHRGDWVFLCTGATYPGLIAEYVDRPRTRRVRLQMLETEPYPGTITTALADGDSMRYYPAFDLPGRAALGSQDPVAAEARAQLLLVQRRDGGLTIGDTHDYDEPFPFDLDEGIYSYLLATAGRILYQPVPAVRRRWAGIYSEVLDKERNLYWREEILPQVEVVSGPGGRGMTCAPAIAEASIKALAARS
jgi:FAD dependent oxidoreductase TIGR03364